MVEMLLTRHNHLIDPHLEIWEWQIPVYIFLGGLSAGLIILSSVIRILGKGEMFSRSMRWGAFLAPAIITVGMGMLFLDLGYKFHVFRFYMKFNPTSAMSWGSWILLLIYPFNLLFLADVWKVPSLIPPKILPADSTKMIQDFFQRHHQTIAKVNLALGIALGIYTGVLLSSFVAMHLWNSGLLGPLFLFSGMSSAVALCILMEKTPEARHALVRVDKYLIVGELLLIVLLLIDLTSGCQMSKCAARFLMIDRFAVFFWVIVVGLGLVFPLIAEVISTIRKEHRAWWVAPVMVITGSLALRFLFIIVGQVVTCFEKGIL